MKAYEFSAKVIPEWMLKLLPQMQEQLSKLSNRKNHRFSECRIYFMYEIHVLRASAEAVESDERYPLGERYPITIFSRQLEGKETNYELAAERAFSAGWDDFEFDITRAVVVASEKEHLISDETFAEAFRHALFNEAAVVVYTNSLSGSEWQNSKPMHIFINCRLKNYNNNITIEPRKRSGKPSDGKQSEGLESQAE